MMPGPAGQPALRGMVPDLSDIGWREPPSPAVFGGISLVHEAAATCASAAYPSAAPIAAITARATRAAARAITDRLRRACSARSDAALPLRGAAQRCLGPKCKPARRINCDSRASIIRGRKRNCTSSLRINERQAALTSHNYCDNKIALVARHQLEFGGCCFAGRSKPSRAKHCRNDGL
jgi:hypothetical protein